MNSSEVELVGRGHLIEEVLRAGLQAATPLFDRGIDLLVFREGPFRARPIQLKAATRASFEVSSKYQGRGLLLALVWGVGTTERECFAMPYKEALAIASRMGYLETASWGRGTYATTRPSARLRQMLEPWRSTPKLWARLMK